MAEKSYEHAKNEIKKRSISPEQLEHIKDCFDDEINSVRLKSCLQSIDDILDSLECRDVLNENKTDALDKIFDILDDKESTDNKLINDRSLEQKNSSSTSHYYDLKKLREKFKKEFTISNDELQRQQEVNDVAGGVCIQPSLFYPSTSTARIPIHRNNLINGEISNTDSKKNIIYKLIIKEIGRKWRAFGRGLYIREGEMDELEQLYPNEEDAQTRVMKMLELFEEPGREDPRKYNLMICNALDECGRQDLRKKINEILTRD